MTIQQLPGDVVKIGWIEPSTNADGSPLTDLAKIVIRGTVAGFPTGDMEVAVSGPGGGQPGEHSLVGLCGLGTAPAIELDIVAVDLVGNESEPEHVSFVLDCLAPERVQ